MGRPKISELRNEITELRRVGGQMSNVCFNYGQSGIGGSLDEHSRNMLQDLAKQWDAIKRTEPSK